MSKILLINPPFYRLLGSHYNDFPLGLSYIAAVLNINGHDAWIYNSDYESKVEYKTLSGIFDGSENYDNYFLDINHPLWQDIIDKILSFEPDWIGYTCYTANIPAIDIISHKVKDVMPLVKQVVGGIHPSLDQNTLSVLSAIDFSISGQGEYSFLSLVDGADSKSSVNIIDNLDLLPFPEREKYYGISEDQKKHIDRCHIITGRGCPYHCTYCAGPKSWVKNKLQFRTPESVLSELSFIKDHYWSPITQPEGNCSGLVISYNSTIYFIDDVFTVHKKRVMEIMQLMVDRSLTMPWKCEARADNLDEERCELMKASGCIRVKMGFESGSERILKQIKKGETKEQMRTAAMLLRKYDIPLTAYFMAGFPGETDEDLRQTIQFAKEIDADFYSISILSPYYGTEIYDSLLTQGIQLDKMPWQYFYHQRPEPVVNGNLSKNLLVEYFNLNGWKKETLGYV